VWLAIIHAVWYRKYELCWKPVDRFCRKFIYLCSLSLSHAWFCWIVLECWQRSKARSLSFVAALWTICAWKLSNAIVHVFTASDRTVVACVEFDTTGLLSDWALSTYMCHSIYRVQYRTKAGNAYPPRQGCRYTPPIGATKGTLTN
jgi:hypothetical protein